MFKEIIFFQSQYKRVTYESVLHYPYKNQSHLRKKTSSCNKTLQVNVKLGGISF